MPTLGGGLLQPFIHATNIYWLPTMGFPRGSDGKESVCNAGNPGLIPGSGRSPGGGNGNPLQDSCLEKSLDRGAWKATAHGVTKSGTQPRSESTEAMFSPSKKKQVCSGQVMCPKYLHSGFPYRSALILVPR